MSELVSQKHREKRKPGLHYFIHWWRSKRWDYWSWFAREILQWVTP